MRMDLTRWLALAVLAVFLVYGWNAWTVLDDLLVPILRRNPVWPSTFPKVISIAGVLVALAVIFNVEKATDIRGDEPDWHRWREFRLVTALALLAMMVVYAIALRPAGFLVATATFLGAGAWLLGERRVWRLVVIPALAAGGVWWLVGEGLGIYMVPLPGFLR